MRKLSEVQSELTKLRKLYRIQLTKENTEGSTKIANKIHVLEWVLEIQNKL